LATFADIDGPAHKGAFLNGITVDVLAGSQTEDPPQELVQQSLQRLLDQGPGSHEYYQALEPIHEVDIGGVTGLTATVRLTWNERVMVKALYLCIANHCLYQIGLQTDDVDWTTYEPLFGRVLDSFAFAPASF
jgi:thioredoxin-like negative regulator of GroEL